MTVTAVKEELLNRVGTDPKKTFIARIGPAGENLVSMAFTMNDEYWAAGRTGSGAVMGSKKLKAVVVFGNKMQESANSEILVQKVAESMSLIREKSDYRS
jgi:aldehyde:ferredoxin oxidoreductase